VYSVRFLNIACNGHKSILGVLSQARVRGKFTSRQCRRFEEGLAVSDREAGEKHRTEGTEETEDTEDTERSGGEVVGRGQARSLSKSLRRICSLIESSSS
jgi:hypothetical protein